MRKIHSRNATFQWIPSLILSFIHTGCIWNAFLGKPQKWNAFFFSRIALVKHTTAQAHWNCRFFSLSTNSLTQPSNSKQSKKRREFELIERQTKNMQEFLKLFPFFLKKIKKNNQNEQHIIHVTQPNYRSLIRLRYD